MTVIGIFGPTASGKSRVAEALAERIPSELVSADAMQVYRGLPILTNQSSHPTRLVAIWPLDQEASLGAYTPLAHAAIDEILAGGRTPVVVGGTGLYLRAALADLELPPSPEPGARERWQQLYDDDPEAAHAGSASSTRPPQPLSTRTTGAGSCARSSSPKPDPRSRPTPTASGRRRHGIRPSSSGSICRRRSSSGGSRSGPVRCSTPAWRTKYVRALAEPLSATARKTLGLDEVAELPRDEAIAAIIVRTRRYAAYQRKWMRRVPGLVMVDADRPPGDIADDIVALARPRERLPRR